MERLDYKNKAVRAGLSSVEKKTFFNRSVELIYLIKKLLPMKFFSKNYYFLDTSRLSADDAAKYMLKEVI